jgi:hypothetical protein
MQTVVTNDSEQPDVQRMATPTSTLATPAPPLAGEQASRHARRRLSQGGSRAGWGTTPLGYNTSVVSAATAQVSTRNFRVKGGAPRGHATNGNPPSPSIISVIFLDFSHRMLLYTTVGDPVVRND